MLIAATALALSVTGCRADELWGVPLQQARERLERGDSSLLSQVQLDEGTARQALRLGPEAPYYLALRFGELGRSAEAEVMLRLEVRRGAGIWKEAAAVELLQQLLGQERYSEAEELGEEALRWAKHPPLRAAVERGLVEALYWQERDREVLERLAGAAGKEDDELVLFKAVSSCRLGRTGWPRLFVRLFAASRSSTVHLRALAFLSLEDRLRSFSAPEQALFKGKTLLYRGQTAEAVPELERAVAGLAPVELQDTVVLEELTAAYFASGMLRRGAEFLLEVSPRLGQAGRLLATELAGRLLRKEGSWQRSAGLLLAVAEQSADPRQRDRACWYYLDLVRRFEGGRFLPELERLAPRWEDAGYFSDLLEEEITELTALGRWQDLQRLAGTQAGEPAVRARMAYVLGRAGTMALGSGAPSEAQGRRLLEQARLLDPDGYYGFLAAAALARSPAGGEAVPAAEAREEDAPGTLEGQVDRFIWELFDYGLEDRTYHQVLAQQDYVSDALIRRSAAELTERQRYLASIRLMYLYARRRQGRAGAGELALLYPRGFRGRIEEVAAWTGLSEHLLFALVREESHFDARIVSRSGAVGLMQLMPETASDAARRLRVEDPDLEDPLQNLRLGASHLARLLDRANTVPRALLAYNAGLSRLRGWERRFPHLPDDLLVEAIPYQETRHYVRKILVSAVHYGYLYFRRSAAETVGMFYPALGPRPPKEVK